MSVMYDNIFTKEKLQKIHNNALGVLQNIGIKTEYEGFYDALIAKGATVDKAKGIIKFPPSMVEETIADLKNMLAQGKKQFILNGIMSTKSSSGLKLKFAGACIEFLDPLSNEVKTPTKEDLIRLIKFGESIKEVTYVGNPLCYLFDEKGERVKNELQRVLTAGVVAKYTTKYGSNEVWNDKELDLLIELGEIVRGSKEAFDKTPCFVTAKETISPLFFPDDDARVLHMLAKRNLPCTIIPMPISGATSTMSIAGNMVMGTAEILGVMTCLHAVCPNALLGGGVISGVMDMKYGCASFASPEAILQDVGYAKLFEELYGQNFGMGTGYIDALYPGAQSAVEIYAKMHAAFQMGRYNYPCGLLLAGKRFSPVQALICVEMAKYIERNYMDFNVDDDVIAMDVMEDVGIGGNYLGEMHTFEHFKTATWIPDLIQRQLTQMPDVDLVIEKAKDMWSDFVKNCDICEPAVDEKTAKEIDEWQQKAIRILSE